MTQDFLDDFSEQMDKEKRAYVIMVMRQSAPFGIHIRTEFEHWPEHNYLTKEDDAIRALQCALSPDGLFLTSVQRQSILGMLDMLGCALADHKHTWTDGERASYEQTLETLTGKKEEPSTENPNDD